MKPPELNHETVEEGACSLAVPVRCNSGAIVGKIIPIIFFNLLGLILLFPGKTASAERPDDILIIVNKNLKSNGISLSDLRRIFLKQKTTLNGERIVPINARVDSSLRHQFTRKVLRKSVAEELDYWEKQKIKTSLSPPSELTNTLRGIFSVKNAISYCFRKDYTPRMAKILLVL